MGISAYREIVLSSKADDEASILSVFRDIYASDPDAVFSLLNIYKELPINNNGAIFDIKGKVIEFRTIPLQLAAIDFCKETVIQAPFLNAAVLGRAVYLDIPHQLVGLGDFSYAEVNSDKRNAVRVRLKTPANVSLTVSETKVSGVIRDISLSGCCVSTLLGQVFEQAGAATIHLKLMHEGQIHETDVPVRIVRVAGTGPYECAMVFQHNGESERILSMFIYQRQLEIIRELKEKT